MTAPIVEVVDHQPAPDGWRVWTLDTAERLAVARPVAGWATVDVKQHDPDTRSWWPAVRQVVATVPALAPTEPPQRLGAGRLGELAGALRLALDPWLILGPGQPDPTDRQIADALDDAGPRPVGAA